MPENCDRGNSCYFTCEHFRAIFAYSRKGGSAASLMTICRTTILHSTKEGWEPILSRTTCLLAKANGALIVIARHLLCLQLISVEFLVACCGRRRLPHERGSIGAAFCGTKTHRT